MSQHPKWLQNAVAFDMDYAAEVLRGNGAVPTIIVIRGRERHTILQAQFSDVEQKVNVYKTAALIAYVHEARALTMLTEAWMRTVTGRAGESDAEIRRRSREVLPSEAMDRIEVISCHAVYRDEAGETVAHSEMREILRKPDGKFYGLAEPIDTAGAEVVDSLLLRCLPAKDLPPPQPTTIEAVEMLLRIGIEAGVMTTLH